MGLERKEERRKKKKQTKNSYVALGVAWNALLITFRIFFFFSSSFISTTEFCYFFLYSFVSSPDSCAELISYDRTLSLVQMCFLCVPFVIYILENFTYTYISLRIFSLPLPLNAAAHYKRGWQWDNHRT